MAINAAAKSNHDQLFGDRVSALAQSDPELIEYFDNFAFGEVPADAVLTVLVPFIGYPRTLNGLAALNDITAS